MPQPVRRRRGAYTLIELMLVVTIMAIMAGAAFPVFRNAMRGTAVRDAAGMAANIVRYARGAAVMGGSSARLAWEPGAFAATLSVETDPLNRPGAYAEQPLPIRIPARLAREVQVTGLTKLSLMGGMEDMEMIFQPNGSTDDSFLYLSDGAGTVYTVGVVGLTGQVMVWDREASDFYTE